MPIDSWFDQVVPEAEARGEARGTTLGEQNSEERMRRLCAAMEADGRITDFLAAMKDTSVLHSLYKEYGIEAPSKSE